MHISKHGHSHSDYYDLVEDNNIQVEGTPYENRYVREKCGHGVAWIGLDISLTFVMPFMCSQFA